MIFTNTLTLLLALAPVQVFSHPTATINSLEDLMRRYLSPAQVKQLQDGACDLSQAVMPTAPTPLPPPSAGLTVSHIALGRGTQNYTCTNTTLPNTPKALGALATLFNVTCETVRAPAVVSDVTSLALNYPIPTSDLAQDMESGHHFFSDKGVPTFKLETPAVNFGWVQAKPAANSSAPLTAKKSSDGAAAVPWLKLNAIDGDWQYKEVYRVNTAGGSAPKTCDGISGTFQVEYSAMYWFWS